MRLLTSSLAVLALACAVRFYKAGNWLADTAAALHEAGRRPPSMHPVERVMLGSIVGMALCTLWMAMVWRAA